MSEWIRIVGPGADTRRPPIGSKAICWDENTGSMFLGEYNLGSSGECWHDGEFYEAVTHWMPAPEPPE